MKQRAMKRSWLKTVLAALAISGWGVGVADAQSGGGGDALPPPVFNAPVHFHADVGYPFGLAATDYLDASGNPGQDGYPEIAVAGVGVHLFEPDHVTDCTDSPLPHFIKIYHNLGADPNFAWDGPNADQALSLVQTLNISNADPEMWAMELAFADVTGINGPDLVLVGQDPDVPAGFLVVFKNNGDGTFDPTPQVWQTTVPLEGVVVKDFDLDGDIDVIASSSNLHLGWECANGDAPAQTIVVVFEKTGDPFTLNFTSRIVRNADRMNNLFQLDPALDMAFVPDRVIPHEQLSSFSNVPPSARSVRANLLIVDLDADGFDDIVVADHIYNEFPQIDTITVHINALSISSGP